MGRTQIQIFLGAVLVSMVIAVIIYTGFTEETRMVEWSQAQQAESIEVGAALFENNCSGCHGTKGDGIQGLAPPLNDRHFFTERLQEVGWQGSLQDYIISTVSTGRPVSTRPQYVGGGKPAMPTWSQEFGGPLRPDQIRNIAAFIMNWEPTAMGQVELAELPTPTPGAAEAADPVARGQQVFMNSGCAGCHTIEGISNGVVGPNLTHIGTIAETIKPGTSAEDYIRESILNPNAYVVDGFQPNIMPQNFGQQLSNQQLNDLIAFLLSHK